ncbi:class I SAM-dependent methyltransferase [Streptomyces longwoodensis]|uniref:class I SAM-dependent methyltransferase n=1 Tax=Streptomyces longwoodensis TaxID=68231 RepID=UPI0033B00D36
MTNPPPPQQNPAAPATRRSYDTVAERYAADIGAELPGKPLDRALLDAFAEVTRHGPVADVGCGPGHATAHLAARGVAVTGLDLSPGMCAVARRGTGLPFAVADMTALPLRSGSLTGLLCWYALIHLDPPRRAAAYAEFARVLRPGGHALLAFHTSTADARPGESAHFSDWWDHPVDLTFHFLDPATETTSLTDAGLTVTAHLDRAAYPGVEHPSRRSYLLVRRDGEG